MNKFNQRGYQGEEHYYNRENIPPPLPFGRHYRWQIIALVAIGFAALFAFTTFTLRGMCESYSPVTHTPSVVPNSILQGQFTYYPGEPYTGSFQATLQILSHSGRIFTGTLSEPLYGNTTVNVTGVEGGGSLFHQSQLQYITQLYGNGTGTFIEFTDPTYVEGNQIQLNCTYIAVVSVDGSFHGAWFYPGSNQPDGTFLLNKVS